MSVTCHPRHLRQAKLCTRGGRDWFRANGLDWSDFVSNGCDESVLLNTKDPMAARVVEAARKEAANG